MLVDLLDVLDVAFRLPFVVSDQRLYFLLVLLDLAFDSVFLRRQLLNLGRLPVPGALLVVQLVLQLLFLLLEARLQGGDLGLQVVDLPAMQLLALVMLHLLRFQSVQLLRGLLALGNGNFEGLSLDEELVDYVFELRLERALLLGRVLVLCLEGLVVLP